MLHYTNVRWLRKGQALKRAIQNPHQLRDVGDVLFENIIRMQARLHFPSAVLRISFRAFSELVCVDRLAEAESAHPWRQG